MSARHSSGSSATFAGIKAVTFDVGGTLIRPWPSVGHIYASVAGRNGHPNVPAEALNRNFSVAWQARRNFNHTFADWAGLVDATFAQLVPVPPSRTFFPQLYQRFAEADAWKLFDDVLPVLDSLASAGIPIAVVSNWDERLRPLLKALRVETYFETILVSSEVAFAKPSPVIFEMAAQKLGLAPGDILHIGDSRMEDFDGAASAGLRSLLIERNTTARVPNGIGSLHELPSLLLGI